MIIIPRLADPKNVLVRAVALANEYFHSGRLAFHSNTPVILEFRRQDVVVHSATMDPATSTVLYTYWYNEGKHHSSSKEVQRTGLMPKGMQFLMCSVFGDECLWCGKRWLKTKSQEASAHIDMHWAEAMEKAA